MIDWFLKTVKSNPTFIALIDDGKRYSYEDLYIQAKNIAFELQKTDNHFIGLYTDNNFFTYAGILGILMAGKAFVPLNHKFPKGRLKNIIAQVDLKTIICCEISYNEVSQLTENSNILISDKLNKTKSEFSIQNYKAHDVCYLLFTSGSTGEPKGIPITYSNFTHFLSSLVKKYALAPQTKVLQTFELSFDVSIACTFLALSTESTLVLVPLAGIIAVNAFKVILDYKVEVVCMAPSAVNYLKNYKLVPQFQLPFVHTTIFTGEALPYDTAKIWSNSAKNSLIDNAYGPTEVTVWSYFYRLNNNTEIELENGLCPIGKELDGVKSKIEPIETNLNRGQLLLGGEHVFKEYWKNEKKTSSAFLTDEKGEKWYKTGDLVIINQNENVVYINRIDNQVKINGYRVELGEIEFALKKRLDGAGVAVIVKNDSKGNPQLIAYTDAVGFNANDIYNAVKQDLAFYMLPKEIVYLKNLPLNASGKIDRLALKAI